MRYAKSFFRNTCRWIAKFSEALAAAFIGCVRKKWIEYEAHRFEREIDMTETATRNRSRPRFKPAPLKLSANPPKTALQRRSLQDQWVAKLREMSLNGDLRPGSPLPEKMLCESFGVSRTPLRE